ASSPQAASRPGRRSAPHGRGRQDRPLRPVADGLAGLLGGGSGRLPAPAGRPAGGRGGRTAGTAGRGRPAAHLLPQPRHRRGPGAGGQQPPAAAVRRRPAQPDQAPAGRAHRHRRAVRGPAHRRGLAGAGRAGGAGRRGPRAARARRGQRPDRLRGAGDGLPRRVRRAAGGHHGRAAPHPDLAGRVHPRPDRPAHGPAQHPGPL
ncbi:MAG: hypothetical protein AVDCRST_MAG41-274, partial [uncultured Corynebacteriales bacterium]